MLDCLISQYIKETKSSSASIRKVSGIIKKAATTTTTVTAPRLGLVVAVAIGLLSVGYILFLAILAPQQLAEAAVTATNVVCNGCVGSSDIADNSIRSVDIENGQIRTEDIGAGQVRTGDIADNAIQPNLRVVVDSQGTQIAPGNSGTSRATCPSEYRPSGGGYSSADVVKVFQSIPSGDSWSVSASNTSPSTSGAVQAWAVCIGPMP